MALGLNTHMKRRNALATALALIIVLGAVAAALWRLHRDPEAGRIYAVRDIVDFDDKGGNVMARIQVYLDGDAGHVKEIACLFPPDTEISESTPGVSGDEVAARLKADPTLNPFSVYSYASWHGISKFRVMRPVENFTGVAYYCEVLEVVPNKTMEPTR